MNRGEACALAVGVLVLLASAADAQDTRTALASHSSLSADRVWTTPLDRRVTLRFDGVTLREALDKVAAAARLRLSYSAELLPLGRTVQASYESVPAGDVLVSLLASTTIEPVPVGSDQVVLAPRRVVGAAAEAAESRPAQTLASVVVTERASGDEVAPRTVAVDVVRRDEIVANAAGSLARTLDGAVPGLWLWEQSPASLFARYGSIRGASSFGASAPKVFIDGIQVANPLLLTRFLPGNVDHVDVIRGPQGAALYGADAIGGVVNIVTRHEGVDDGAPRAELRSEIGTARSDYATGGVLSQEHALVLRSGTSLRSADATLAFGGLGDFYPGANSRHLAATGGFRVIGAHSSITGIARFFSEHAGVAPNPILLGSPPGTGAPGATLTPPSSPGAAMTPSATQSVRQYTIGTTVQIVPNEHLTNTFTVGIDGYRLDASSAGATASATPGDTTGAPATSTAWEMVTAPSAADRVTMRASTAGRFGAPERTGITITAAAEQSVLRQAGSPFSGAMYEVAGAAVAAPALSDWFGTSGLTLAADLALRGTLHLTGGVRLDRSEGFTPTAQHAVLPMIGGALVRRVGGVSVTVRSAYGKAIRPPRAGPMDGEWPSYQDRAAGLAPEVQSGVEAGVDLSYHRALSVRLTRFDQRATGLIQRVAVGSAASGIYPSATAAAGFRNVGEISNRGWEMQGAVTHGSLTMAGTMSLVDSRVRRLATGYVGDLRSGDRMLEVPSSTTSMSAAWTRAKWSAAMTASRAFDWIGYDRHSLAAALCAGENPAWATGVPLREFWRRYDGVTHLRATASRSLGRGFSGTVTVDNLLDRQIGEPDDITVVPGRTISAALRVAF